jgi:hypothetical protein
VTRQSWLLVYPPIGTPGRDSARLATAEQNEIDLRGYAHGLALLADVRICRCAGVAYAYTYALASMSLMTGGNRQLGLVIQIVGAPCRIRAACSHAVGVRCCVQIIRFWAMWIPCAIERRRRRLLPMRPFGAALAASAAGFSADRSVR